MDIERTFLEKGGERNMAITEEALKEKERFYRSLFGVTPDFSNLFIPLPESVINRLLVIAEGLTLNQVFYDICQNKFPCWSYAGDIDEIIIDRSGRKPVKTYAIWVPDIKEVSTNPFGNRDDVESINLLERLILELDYWFQTGGHLDERSATLCRGSRDLDGNIPVVFWGGAGLAIHKCPKFAESRFCSRPVVLLKQNPC